MARPVAVIAVGIGVWGVGVIAIVAVLAVTAIGTGVAVIATIAVGAMIDVVMPAIAVDRPIVQQTAVAIMLHGEGVAVSVVAVTVIGGAAALHDIGDIDQLARPRILRLGLRAHRNNAHPHADDHRG